MFNANDELISWQMNDDVHNYGKKTAVQLKCVAPFIEIRL
jgi:hypothetical protein